MFGGRVRRLTDSTPSVHTKMTPTTPKFHDAEHVFQHVDFIKWCQQKNDRNCESLDLYNAILDYDSKLDSQSPPLSLLKLARHIHRKYVSLNTGTCHVIDDQIRTEMSARIHELLGGRSSYKGLFDPLKPILSKYLTKLHNEFLADEEKPSKWESACGSSQRSSCSKEAEIWFNENGSRGEKHDITHETEDDRFAFFNAVCSRLNSIQSSTSPQQSSSTESITKLSKSTAPYGVNGFAPPPKSTNLPRRFESLYRKKKQYAPPSESSGFCSGNNSEFMSFERYGRSVTGTLERARNNLGNNDGFLTLQPSKDYSKKTTRYASTFPSGPDQLILELRFEDDIPMVAKIPYQDVRFDYFRNLFGVQNNANYRYFFKSISEDGTALFQWTLALNDDEVLPLFHNKISAMCRICADSQGTL